VALTNFEQNEHEYAIFITYQITSFWGSDLVPARALPLDPPVDLRSPNPLYVESKKFLNVD